MKYVLFMQIRCFFTLKTVCDYNFSTLLFACRKNEKSGVVFGNNTPFLLLFSLNMN